MNLFDFLHSPSCQCLALALLHFLWQGFFIALATASLTSVLGRTSSRIRYGIPMGGLVVMALTVAGTYCVVDPGIPTTMSSFLATQDSSTPLEASPLPPSGSTAPSSTQTITVPEPVLQPIRVAPYNIMPRFVLRHWAPFGVAVYLLGVGLMTLRLILGLCGGQRLRRQSTPVEDTTLLVALKRQVDLLGVKIQPLLLYCTKVTVPTVVGVIRPAILLPLSFASGLTIEQVEMLLCHELAHIRRWDPFWNVVQRVIETFLFFHPAVWFISRRVRLERENCCDDLVLLSGGSPLSYAASLLDAAQHSLAPSTVASLASVGLEAAGRASQVRSRVLRLVGEKEEVRLRRPMLVLLPLVLVGLLVVMPFAGKGNEASNQKQSTLVKTKNEIIPGTGSVHGRVIIDGKPLPDTQIVYTRYWPDYYNYYLPHPPQTDSDGYFMENNLPPGKYLFAIQKGWDTKTGGSTFFVATHSHGVYIDVVAGETTEIQVGGKGRKVIGKFVPVPNEKGDVPGPQGFSERKFAGHMPRPEGLPGHFPGDQWILDINPDGTFEIPDLPPGDYTPIFEQVIYIKGATNDLAVMDIIPDPHKIQIPATTDESNIPYDMGEIRIKMGERLNTLRIAEAPQTPTPSAAEQTNPERIGLSSQNETGNPSSGLTVDSNHKEPSIELSGAIITLKGIVSNDGGWFHPDGTSFDLAGMIGAPTTSIRESWQDLINSDKSPRHPTFGVLFSIESTHDFSGYVDLLSLPNSPPFHCDGVTNWWRTEGEHPRTSWRLLQLINRDNDSILEQMDLATQFYYGNPLPLSAEIQLDASHTQISMGSLQFEATVSNLPISDPTSELPPKSRPSVTLRFDQTADLLGYQILAVRKDGDLLHADGGPSLNEPLRPTLDYKWPFGFFSIISQESIRCFRFMGWKVQPIVWKGITLSPVQINGSRRRSMPSPIIQGQVTDAEGNPLNGVIIQCVEHFGKPIARPKTFETSTDQGGNYSLNYMPNWPVLLVAVWESPYSGQKANRIQVIYKNNILEESRTVNFKYDNVPTCSSGITGRLLDRFGNVITDYEIMMSRVDMDETPVFVKHIPPNTYHLDYRIFPHSASGEFELKGIPSGKYNFFLNPRPFAKYIRNYTPIELSLSEGEIRSISFDVPTKNTFFAKVKLADGSPVVIEPAPWEYARTYIHVPTGRCGAITDNGEVDRDGLATIFLSDDEIIEVKSGRNKIYIYRPDVKNIPRCLSNCIGYLTFNDLYQDPGSAKTVILPGPKKESTHSVDKATEDSPSPTPTPTNTYTNTPTPQTGSVHGRVMIGKVPQANQQISVEQYAGSPPGMVFPRFLTTDAEGYFHAENMPIGKYRFSRITAFTMLEGLDSNSPVTERFVTGPGYRAEIRPGESTEVKMGWGGRRVIGRLVSVPNAQGETFTPMSLQTRYFTLQEERKDSLGGFTVVMDIQKDGSFELPDAIPGNYITHMEACDPSHAPYFRSVLSTPSHFSIPPASPGHEDEPYDVGEIMIQLDD